MNYIKGYLILDAISSIPISFITIQDTITHQVSSHALQSAKFIRIIRFTRYLRVLKLFRLVKMSSMLQGIEILITNEATLLSIRFAKIMFFVLFISHWFACLLNGITYFESQPFGLLNWYAIEDLQDAPVFDKYVNCIYWVITTTCTVGYGDFFPVTSTERIVVILCMIFQSSIFAYIIGDIGRTVSNQSMLATHFKERMNYVDTFLREKDIPKSLRLQVKRYLEYNWELKKLCKIEETEMLAMLNDNLRGKIIVFFNGKILKNIEVLGAFPIEFLSNLSFILAKRVYAIDDDCVLEREQG